jgi:hypothetical protein
MTPESSPGAPELPPEPPLPLLDMGLPELDPPPELPPPDDAPFEPPLPP